MKTRLIAPTTILFLATMGCARSSQPTPEAAAADRRQPPPVQVTADDVTISNAIQQARAEVDHFISALENPQPNQKAFSVLPCI